MNTQDPHYGMRSNDGRMWWDGEQWQPVPEQKSAAQPTWVKWTLGIIGGLIALILAIGVVGTVVGTEGDTTSTPKAAPTSPPAPAPAYTPPPPVSDNDIALAAMEMVWNDMAYDQRSTICEGWNIPELQDMLLNEFLSSWNDTGSVPISPSAARGFFDEKC